MATQIALQTRPSDAARRFLTALGRVTECVTSQRLFVAWRVTTLSDEYRILDSRQSELLTYHWDPVARRGPLHPHIHVNAEIVVHVDAATRRPLRLEGYHILTGRVSLEAVVWFLIRELGVEDRAPRWVGRLKSSMAVLQSQARQLP